MKMLIINGSAHKGNTWKLAEKAKDEISRLDEKAVYDEIHLIAEKLPFCTGCSECFRKGHENCPHFTVMDTIIKKIEEADGVIFISTTYNMRETALLKNFFDHLCFMLHRPHFFKCKALVITTTGGVGGGAAAKSIKSFLMGIGFNRCYTFSRASFSWNAYIPNERTIRKLEKTVKKFYTDIKSAKLHSPGCMLLIPYNLFRGMSLAYVPGTEYETEDGVYWTDESRRKKVYVPYIKVNILKKLFGQIFYGIGKMAGRLKSMTVTYKK